MNCPHCGEVMAPARLGLQAWGLGAAPSARLWLDGAILRIDQYVPVVGLLRRRGTAIPAQHCVACRTVVFAYDERDQPRRFGLWPRARG